jgi:hypothetical protein
MGPYRADHINMASVLIKAGMLTKNIIAVNVIRSPNAPLTSTKSILDNQDGIPTDQYKHQWTDVALTFVKENAENGVTTAILPYDLPAVVEENQEEILNAWNKNHPNVALSLKLDMDMLHNPQIADWGQAGIEESYYNLFVGPTINRGRYEYVEPTLKTLRGIPQHEEIRATLGPLYKKILTNVAGELSLTLIPKALDEII